MAKISECDYCGDKKIYFSLKVKDEYGTSSNNNSVTNINIEKPCLIPICSASLNESIEFDFTNSHHKDATISYKHSFYITKNGGSTEFFDSLPEGLSTDSLSGNSFTLSDGTVAILDGQYDDFSMSFNEKGTYDVRIVSVGTNAEGFQSNETSCTAPRLVDELAYSFYTSKETNLELVHSDGEGYIDWGDSTITSYNTATDGSSYYHTYQNAATHHVKVYCNPDDVTSINLTNQDLEGTLDIKKLNNLNTLLVDNNSNLLKILNPVANTANWIEYNAEYCQLSGSYDFSNFSNLGGIFKINNNGITNLLLPSSSDLITVFEINNNSITSILDLSVLDLSNTINIGYNTSLRNSILPSTTNVITYLDCQYADLLGDFDCSTMPNLQGTLLINHNSLSSITLPTLLMTNVDFSNNFLTNNANLDLSSMLIEGSFAISGNDSFSFNQIILPTNTSGVMNNINLSNKVNTIATPSQISAWNISSSATINFETTMQPFSVSTINSHLQTLDSFLPGSATGTIELGGSNPAPDSSSGGINGIIYKNSLISKGWTVNTN